MRCPSCGFETPDFHAVVSLVIMQLQHERRITYRAIQRTFGCDDAFLEDVREELILAKEVAYDEGGKVLVWREGAQRVLQSTLPPTSHPAAVETADVTSASATALPPLAARSHVPNIPNIPLEQPTPPRSNGPLLPASEASPAPPTIACVPASESQTLTVLFCDIVGSTPLSGQLDPEDLREIMRAYQQVSVEVIQRFDGYLAQYQGDGLLVYFGYPQSQPDDAQRAVRAGLGIIAAVDQLNARLVRDYKVALAVRIGVHTGLVVLGRFGELGGESQTDSFAVGETPTIAAGVQNVAAPGTVFVSRATQELIGEDFTCEDIRSQTLKGVAAPIAVARVLQDRTVPLADEAERRQLTVMFGELAELSSLAVQVSSGTLLEIVREYQQVCTEVIERFDGHVAQYLENGVLVYFGYPLAHEDDTQRAVRSGLGMLAATQALNTRFQQEHAVQLAMRIGIHTGRVVAGEMGGGNRTEQLAVGETPNVAARILGVAAPGTLVISPTTAQLTTGYFEQEELGTYTLKGVSEPMPVWRVTGESETQSRLELQEAGGLAAIVGRETEEALLAERWMQSRAGHGQVVLLSGEAGIGKSRLVEAVRKRVGRETATQIRFRCSPYYQSSALHPVVEHLQRLLQFQPDESAALRVEKIEQLLTRYQFPDAESVPLLADLLSVPLAEDRYSPLNLAPQKQKEKTLEVLMAWLAEEAEHQPVLTVWEDLHWIDPSSLELLGMLLDETATAQMLLLLTCRPEFVAPWGNRSHLTPLPLSRLGHSEIADMVANVTGGRQLPAALLDQIVTKTDGVPLFVEELTKTIVESGVVQAVNGHYELTGPMSAVTIPVTLQDSLMARLDRLGEAKGLAQLGAVIGREFAYELVQALMLGEEPTLQARLSQLVQTELVYQRGRPPRATYTFKHALIQDTAYASLLRRTRQQYHQQIAQSLAERFAEIAKTQPELLAHHYTEAGLVEQAIPYWQQAGQRAAQRSANAEAVAHLSTGVELLNTLPDTPERAQQELSLQLALGPVLMATKSIAHVDTENAYSRARELCQQLGDTPQLFPVVWGVRRVYVMRAKYTTARELEEQLFRLAQNAQDPGLLLETQWAWGTTSFWLGELAIARERYAHSISLYNPQLHSSHAFQYGSDPGVSASSYHALTLWHLGYPDQALQESRRSITLAQEVAHPFSQAYALYVLAWVRHLRREVVATQTQAEVAIRLATEQEFPQWVALGGIMRGWALALQGESSAGIAELRKSLAAMRALGGKIADTLFLTMLAEAYSRSGELEAERGVLAEALALVDENGERAYEAELYRLEGEMLLLNDERGMMNDERKKERGEAPDYSAAVEACFHKAIDVARQQEAKSWELRAATSLARLWQQQGKKEEARQMLAEIYCWFTEGFDTVDLKEAKRLMGELE